MLTRILTVVAMLALGAGSVSGQTVPPKPAKPPQPPVAAPAPVPEPAPVVVPDVVSLEELARRAAEVAAQHAGVAHGFDALALRAYEEAVIAQSTVRSTQRDVQQKIDEARVQYAYAQAGSGYERGTSLLDRGRYDEAITAFDGVIKAGGSKAEGAHYWKAYAQNRLGQRTEALATLDAMLKAYPNGRWANDARALQVEVKQASGQPVSPDQATDEEIKLIALNSIVRSQPEQAVAIIEKMLAGTASPRVKERALLVLSQAPTPRAKQMLIEIAMGKGNPDLQMRAIDYFGNFTSSDPNTVKQLVEIYRAVSDVDVKKRIIRSLATQGRFSTGFGPMILGEIGGVAWAPGGQYKVVAPVPPAPPVPPVPPSTGMATARAADLEARLTTQTDERSRVREARAAEARAALWQIYQGETSLELKKEIMRTSFLSGDPAKLIEVVRAERNAELRQAGIRSLGMTRDQKATDMLLSIYREDKDPDVRKSVVDALFTQQNAAALIQLARQESDPAMKKALVERLSHMKAKEATDYMMELLRK